METRTLSRARETVELTRTTLGERDFYIFGSYARKQFDDSIEYREGSDLDILIDSEYYNSAVKDFQNIEGINVKPSFLEVPNEGIFSKNFPSSVKLYAYEMTSSKYTPIHLVALLNTEEVMSWCSLKLKIKDGIKYLLLPEKREFTELDRKVWKHNFNAYE